MALTHVILADTSKNECLFCHPLTRSFPPSPANFSGAFCYIVSMAPASPNATLWVYESVKTLWFGQVMKSQHPTGVQKKKKKRDSPQTLWGWNSRGPQGENLTVQNVSCQLITFRVNTFLSRILSVEKMGYNQWILWKNITDNCNKIYMKNFHRIKKTSDGGRRQKKHDNMNKFCRNIDFQKL